MAAITEGIVAGVAAAAEPQGFFLLQAHLMGDAARAEMGAIAKPAVPGAAAGAQVMHPRRQNQRLWAVQLHLVVPCTFPSCTARGRVEQIHAIRECNGWVIACLETVQDLIAVSLCLGLFSVMALKQKPHD